MDLSVASAAAACGDRLAVVWEGGTLSYRELAQRVSAVAAELQRRGLSSSTVVAIYASNRWQTLVLVLSCIEQGIPFVAIHPRWTAQEVAVVESDVQPSALFADLEIESLLAASGTGESQALPVLSPDAPLAILYSSGTTGTPKGAILSRAAFVASAEGSAANLGWQSDDRWLLCLPLCHIGGLSIVTRSLLARRTLVLVSRFEPQAVLKAIDQHRVTLLSLVPTMLDALLAIDQEYRLARVRAVLVGGAATPFSLLERAVAKGVPVLTTYGLTEACSQVTVQEYSDWKLARRGCGTSQTGLELSIRREDGTPLPVSTVGRIWIRGSSLMTGYVGKEPLAGGWFDTGDLGELDEQRTLYVHARRTDLIVTGGENVYPLEVEQALLAFPTVRGAVVFGTPDPRWGAVVSAALVVTESFDRASLESFLSERLASFKRPRLWAQVDAIPELSNGKVDRRRALAEFTTLLRK